MSLTDTMSIKKVFQSHKINLMNQSLNQTYHSLHTVYLVMKLRVLSLGHDSNDRIFLTETVVGDASPVIFFTPVTCITHIMGKKSFSLGVPSSKSLAGI